MREKSSRVRCEGDFGGQLERIRADQRESSATINKEL